MYPETAIVKYELPFILDSVHGTKRATVSTVAGGQFDHIAVSHEGDMYHISTINRIKGNQPKSQQLAYDGLLKMMESFTFLKQSPSVSEISYVSEQFNFGLTLPNTWSGYTEAVTDLDYGWLVTIRHPQWSHSSERMDIPIYVVTIQTWDSIEAGELHPWAAPIGPNDRAHGDTYVLFTAPRYNYSFAEGWEEVEENY